MANTILSENETQTKNPYALRPKNAKPPAKNLKN